jgi:hypothetical protein
MHSVRARLHSFDDANSFFRQGDAHRAFAPRSPTVVPLPPFRSPARLGGAAPPPTDPLNSLEPSRPPACVAIMRTRAPAYPYPRTYVCVPTWPHSKRTFPESASAQRSSPRSTSQQNRSRATGAIPARRGADTGESLDRRRRERRMRYATGTPHDDAATPVPPPPAASSGARLSATWR